MVLKDSNYITTVLKLGLQHITRAQNNPTWNPNGKQGHKNPNLEQLLVQTKRKKDADLRENPNWENHNP